MQTIKQLIAASGTGFNAAITGRTLYVQGCDAGSTLTVTLTDMMGNTETVVGVGAGAKLTPAAGFKNVLITTSADANVQFVVTNGDIDIQLTQVGTNVTNTNANPVPVAIVSEPGAPFSVTPGADFPVKNGASALHVTVDGTVTVSGATLTATNVGINNTTANPVPVQLHVSDITVPVSAPAAAPLATLPNLAQTPATVAPVTLAASATGTVLLAADATRRAVRFYNAGANPVAITPDNTTTYANAAIVLNPGDFWNETEAPGAAWWASTGSAGGATVNLQTVKP